jgi:hypothetical protein
MLPDVKLSTSQVNYSLKTITDTFMSVRKVHTYKMLYAAIMLTTSDSGLP